MHQVEEWLLSMSVDVSTEYFTNMPDRDESEGACCIFMASYVLFCSNISQGGTKYQPFFLTPQRQGQNFLKLHKSGTIFFQTSKNDYIYKEHFQKISGS